MKRILNFKFRILRFQRGYTLVELLAVTSLIVIITGLIVGVLYSTLRGGNKTRSVNDVSQNANYALSVMSNTARLASAVTKVGGAQISDCSVLRQGSSIEFEDSNGNLVEFSCDNASQSIASSSGGIKSYLIDNSVVKVDPQSCSFTCLQTSGNPYESPIIGISFTASQRNESNLFENTASSIFKTSVTIRNYNP